MALKEREKQVLDEKRAVTGRISETTRYLGFGLLATFYALISSKDEFPKLLVTNSLSLLKFMAVCATLAIMLDYFQYLFGAVSVQKAIDRKDAPYRYNKNWISYRGRRFCYVGKQISAVAGSLIFVTLIALNV